MSGTIQKHDIITPEALKVFSEIVAEFQKLLIEAQKLKQELNKGGGFKETEAAAKKAKVQLTEYQKLQKQVATLNSRNTASYKKLNAEKQRLLANQAKENAAIRKQITGNKGLVGSFKDMIKSVGIYAAAVFGITRLIQFFTRDLLNLTKRLDSMSFSMRTIIKDQKELASTNVFLSKTAIAYGQDILTLTERYIKFRAASMQSNMSAAETMKIFDSTAKAASVLGLKTDEVNGVFLALEQMISKGKVTTEELRRQLGERLPGAMGIMADAVGVSISELDKLLKKGEVISTEALPKFAVALEKAYGIESLEMVNNLAAAQGRMTTSWVSFVAALKASSTYTDTINFLNDLLNYSQVAFGFSERMLEIYLKISDESGQAARELVKNFDKINLEGLTEDIESYEGRWVEALKETGVRTVDAIHMFELYVARRKTLMEEDSVNANNLKPFDIEQYKKDLDTAEDQTDTFSKLRTESLKESFVESSKFLSKYGTSLKGIYTEELKLQKESLVQADKLKIQKEGLYKLSVGLSKEVIEQRRVEAGDAVLNYNNIYEANVELEKRLFELQKKEDKKKDDTLKNAQARNAQLIAIDEFLAEKEIEVFGESAEKRRQIEVSHLEYQRELNDSLLDITKITESERSKIVADSYQLQTKIAETNIKYRKQIDEDFLKASEETTDMWREKAISAIYDQANAETVARAEAANKEFQNSSKRQIDKIAIMGKSAIDILEIEYKKSQDIQSLYAEETDEYKRQADIQAQLQEALAIKGIDLTKRLNDQKIKDFQTIVQTMNDIAQAGFDFNQALNNRAVANNERRFELETEAAGENKFKQLVAERKYEKEAAKLKRKQAIADKASNIAQIIANTAVAISKALGQTGIFGLALVPIVAAIGAIQLASVLAQPIPQFAEGVKNFEGGKAIVGDAKGSPLKAGGSELAILPNGNSFLTPSVPTMMNLPSGTDIIPHDETTRILANEAIASTYNMIDMSGTNRHLKNIERNTSASTSYENGYKIVRKSGLTGKYRVK